jgi:hypothetical protein
MKTFYQILREAEEEKVATNFMEAAPRVIHCGDRGWEFIKQPVKQYKVNYAKKSPKDIEELASLRKKKAALIKAKQFKNAKEQYADPEFKKIRSAINRIQASSRFRGNEVEVQGWEYTGNGSREARASLNAYLKGLKVLWKECKNTPDPKERLSELIDFVRNKGDRTIEEVGETGSYGRRSDGGSSFFDRYDFSEAAMNESNSR